MGIPRLVEVDYHLFMRDYKASGAAGCRVEKTDREKWAAYVRTHDIKEASSLTIAKAQAEDIKPVIINCGGASDGYYLYSHDEQIAFRFDRS
jgi:hypothetical protein